LCPNAEICGGCTYQGVPYDEQLTIKNSAVSELLTEAGISAKTLVPAKVGPSVYEYRNKMEYSFGDEVKEGPMRLGLHKKKSYMAVHNTPDCQIVPEDFNTIRDAVQLYFEELGTSFYHKRNRTGFLRNLVLRRGVRTGELLVNLVTTSEQELDEGAFVSLISGLALKDEVVGIVHTINDRRSDTVAKDSMKVLKGRDYYNEELLGLHFKVNAFAFFQTNIEAVERMLDEAFELLPQKMGSTLFDVYCGTGTIALALSTRADRVIGIDIVEDSIAAANYNAELNEITNCEFRCADALEGLEELTRLGVVPDMISVDPPRMGLHPKALKKLIEYNLKEILYISCNPKTFVENMSVLKSAGYELDTLKIYDNFPLTRHTELVSRIIKK
jgi:23S rRNA (uracil-5-)-methyltransferase RumA